MKIICLLLTFVIIFCISCISYNSQIKEIDRDDIVKNNLDSIKHGIEINEEGDTLKYYFDDVKNTATFILDGQVIEMIGDSTKSSGANYKNDSCTYTNWRGITELKKNGRSLFYHNPNIQKRTIKNKDGRMLAMTFDNLSNTALFILDGKTIELKADTVASGLRYSNKNYIFIEHQGRIEFFKDGNSIFSYQDLINE